MRAGLVRLATPTASLVGAVVLAAWVTSLTGSLSGCGIGLSGQTFGATPGAAADADGGAAGAGARDAGGATETTKTTVSAPSVDAGAIVGPAGAVTVGSPLCGMAAISGDASVDASAPCDPDNGACTPTVAVPDAGEPSYFADAAVPGSGGGAAESYTCRVTAERGEAGIASVMPECVLAGVGKAESPCAASRDCAPGFECVVDDSRVHADGASDTQGVCRHYCCDNICQGLRAFCDKETTVGGAVAVPVCVTRPAQGSGDGGAACALLDDSTCGGGGLSCQVVNLDTGEVACVTPGTAMAGQSCELTNCAKGLSCIVGYFPDRTCGQLCDVENNDCPSGQSCAPNATLSNASASVGVCTS